ncbi:MAG: NAD(P)H-hydrate epimerase, partial [Thermomicrobiaceae bacterium]|nr:NAD(P)H-hydrate epimerase [Thermomicrobiaceae bacterium]
MIKLCTVEEIRGAERAAVRAGRSEQELMRLAGQSVAELIHHGNFDEPGAAVFLVGPGNNGGDGLVAAAPLAELGWRCRIWAYGREGVGRAPVSADQASKLLWLGPDDSVADALAEADVVVDAVFGIGGRTELPTEVVNVFQSAWSARVDEGTPLWALDIPSGVDADSGEVAEGAFRADRTVMIGLPKVGLYRPPAIHYTGTLQLVDIGLPQPPLVAGAPTLPTGVDVRRWLP